MAKANFDFLFTYKFHAEFLTEDLEPIDLEDLGFTSMSMLARHCGVRQTPLGFEAWTAHRVEQPVLYDLLKTARRVQVTLGAPPDMKSRVISLDIGDPVCLPINLDAMADNVALDGVLFKEAKVLSVIDRHIKWPPNGSQ
jgi:hypothetical protein